MEIIVDSRTRDNRSEMVVKHEDFNGNPISHKPIRKVYPILTKLNFLANFIVENENGTYIGGFLNRRNDVRVEGAPGSHPNAGEEMWGIPDDARAFCKGYLFPVFEPADDESEYFNIVAERIEALAGPGGRVIINGNIFEVN